MPKRGKRSNKTSEERKKRQKTRTAAMILVTKEGVSAAIKGLQEAVKNMIDAPTPITITDDQAMHYDEELDEMAHAVVYVINKQQGKRAEEYQVESNLDFNICEHHMQNGEVHTYLSYKVKWTGWEDEPDWWPVEDFAQCKAVDTFWNKVRSGKIKVSFKTGVPEVWKEPAPEPVMEDGELEESK